MEDQEKRENKENDCIENDAIDFDLDGMNFGKMLGNSGRPKKVAKKPVSRKFIDSDDSSDGEVEAIQFN